MSNESIAHLRSASAVIDPVYDSQQLMPQSEVRSDTAPWLYGAGEFECQRLRELRLRVKEAELKEISKSFRKREACFSGFLPELRQSGTAKNSGGKPSLNLKPIPENPSIEKHGIPDRSIRGTSAPGLISW